jgi:glutamine phosphoribosylpyrophosphate amidotransferase
MHDRPNGVTSRGGIWMLDEKGLQEIERKIFKDEDGWNNYMNVSIEEMDWLIAEVRRLNEQNEQIEKDNQQYKQALEFYSDEKRYQASWYDSAGGYNRIAQKALKGEEE